MRILKVKSYFSGTKILDTDIIYNDELPCELVESIHLENGIMLELWGDCEMIEENGKKVRCPICGSTNIKPVLPFDYVKQCENKECSYYKNHPKKWKYQFSTGVHN